MDSREITALGELIARIVGDATAPLLQRIAGLESASTVPADPEVVAAIAAKWVSDELTGIIKADVEAIRADIEALGAETATPGHASTAEELTPLVETAVGRALEAQRKPQDGVGLADALIDRDHVLVLTMTDGRAKSLGRVVGRDGKDAEPFQIFAPEDLAVQVGKALSLLTEAPDLAMLAMPAPAPRGKRIAIQRDNAGGLVAEVVEGGE